MAVGRPKTPTRDQQQITGPLKSLNALASTGLGTAYDLGGAYRNFTVQSIITRASTASPATVAVTLQGTLNGTVWHPLAAATNGTTAGAIWNSTTLNAVTAVRLRATGKGAGAGAFTVSGWIGVA